MSTRIRVIKQKIPPINPIVIIRICNASGKFVKMTPPTTRSMLIPQRKAKYVKFWTKKTPPLIVTSIMDKGESVSGIYRIEKEQNKSRLGTLSS